MPQLAPLASAGEVVMRVDATVQMDTMLSLQPGTRRQLASGSLASSPTSPATRCVCPIKRRRAQVRRRLPLRPPWHTEPTARLRRTSSRQRLALALALAAPPRGSNARRASHRSSPTTSAPGIRRRRQQPLPTRTRRTGRRRRLLVVVAGPGRRPSTSIAPTTTTTAPRTRTMPGHRLRT